MANLVRQAVEPNNTGVPSAPLVLYFDAYPSWDDVVEAYEKAGYDSNHPCFEWTAFSHEGLTRVFCHPGQLEND